ncbi:hypothetical protein AA309_04465 [Microvirga vignae]|uniref:Uncharacterized protein n=1 Tax=Microvirga vignae TaxID=1225564 RepID=A0A0H1RNF2_9HYPH|nr:hypothetical protein [Microvirga vignae]KLK94217.1 hypothetical protein AA309_04465 [Microvirga vignae]
MTVTKSGTPDAGLPGAAMLAIARAQKAIPLHVAHAASALSTCSGATRSFGARTAGLADDRITVRAFAGDASGTETTTIDLCEAGDIDMGFHLKSTMAPEVQKPAFLESLPAFKGFKLRMSKSPAAGPPGRALSALPVAVPRPGTHAAIGTGLIDGAENTPDWYVASRHIEITKDFHRTNHPVGTIAARAGAGTRERIPPKRMGTPGRPSGKAENCSFRALDKI